MHMFERRRNRYTCNNFGDHFGNVRNFSCNSGGERSNFISSFIRPHNFTNIFGKALRKYPDRAKQILIELRQLVEKSVFSYGEYVHNLFNNTKEKTAYSHKNEHIDADND